MSLGPKGRPRGAQHGRGRVAGNAAAGAGQHLGSAAARAWMPAPRRFLLAGPPTCRGAVASDAWRSSASGLLQALESLPGARAALGGAAWVARCAAAAARGARQAQALRQTSCTSGYGGPSSLPRRRALAGPACPPPAGLETGWTDEDAAQDFAGMTCDACNRSRWAPVALGCRGGGYGCTAGGLEGRCAHSAQPNRSSTPLPAPAGLMPRASSSSRACPARPWMPAPSSSAAAASGAGG